MEKFSFDVVAKADPVKRQLSGVIYKANVIDTQGEFMTEAELEKAAHAALANGVGIDVQHSGQALAKSHAALVQSVVKNGAWSGVVQLSTEAWDQLIKSSKVAAFSIGGTAPRRTVAKDGKNAKEIFDAKIGFISLVKKGANGEQFVAKSDDLSAVVEAIAKMRADVAELKAQLSAPTNVTNATSLTKAALLTENDVRKSIKLDELRNQHLVKSAVLESVWEGTILPGESRVQSEQRLARELHQLEMEMAALGKSGAVDLLDPNRSAFTHRGGTSEQLRSLPSDSGWLRTTAVNKGDEDIDLSSLHI
jgi:Putative phage serine protease XkdF